MATIQQSASPKAGLGLAFTAMAMLFSVMMLGVYISSSNQGLSCPDWPLCPNGFDLPSEKYFFEHVHRLMVIITASLIFATAAYSVKKMKEARKTALLAAIIVCVQIVFGMLVVTTGLEPLLAATHLSTGILLFSMVLLTFLSAYRLARKRQEPPTL